MKQKGTAFLLTGCMLLNLFWGNAACEAAVNAPAGTQGEEGLQAAWDITWDDDGIPSLAEDARYYGADEEQGADILWGAVWSIKNGDELVTDASTLHIYKENDGGYTAADTVGVAVHEQNSELLEFSFSETGRYHICLDENMVHRDSDEEQGTEADSCLKVSVDYPEMGFYRTSALSEENIIRDDCIDYRARDCWYLIANDAEWLTISDVSFEFTDGTPDVLFDIETIEENRKYKVSANAVIDTDDWSDDWNAGIRAGWTAADTEGNSWPSDREQYFHPAEKRNRQGLTATNWMYWDEELNKDVPSDDLEGFSSLIYTSLEDKLCFKYNDGTNITEDENGTHLGGTPLRAGDIKIYVKADNGKLVEASKDRVTLKQNEAAPEFVDVSFKSCGYYLAAYTPAGGEESRAVINVQYPQGAFYTSAASTESGLIRGGMNYSRNDRTFYYVIHQEEDEGVMRPLVAARPSFKIEPSELNVNDKVTVTPLSDTVYEIKINQGVTEEFTVIADGCKVKWDENEEADDVYSELQLSYEMIPEVTALTITPKDIEVEVGKEVQLNAEAKSEDGTAVITYQSGDNSVAAVDAGGRVTGIKAGKTEITVTAALGESVKTETAAVTVKESAGAGQNPPAVQPPADPTQDPPQGDVLPSAWDHVKAEDGSVVTTAEDGTAVLNAAAAKKNAASVKVPDKVVVNGISYTVTSIGANAFRDVADTVTGITLPASITKLDKNAFKGLKKLRKITVKTVTDITVVKGAFKGVKTKKVTITVSRKMPKKVLKKFKANLKKAGFLGTVKVK